MAEEKLVNGLTLEERYQLVRSIGEECIQEKELRTLLEKKPLPVCYDGFEPSGRMHIAQGVMKALNVNKLTKAGCVFKFWVADWFAMLNNKMGGDLKKIRKVGEYMIEVWKAIGMDMDGVEFHWTSDEINERSDEYWPLVMDIARLNTLKRIIRCSQIMGRAEAGEDGMPNLNLTAAQIFYPCMQCADIFFLKADICQLGMDQRKVNMLAREYCDMKKKKLKPIILSHHMLSGLLQGQEKMSKSDPSSAIFMEDSESDVKTKIKKAYCPPEIVEGNPCLEYIQYVVLPWFGEFEVKRKEENGGDKTYGTYEELEADFKSGALHPGDVKPALTKAINSILQPVRDHFQNNAQAKQLLKQIKSYVCTKVAVAERAPTKAPKVEVLDLKLLSGGDLNFGFPYSRTFCEDQFGCSAGKVIELLEPLMIEERSARLSDIIGNRIYDIVPVVEGLYDLGNIAAVSRTVEGLGIGSVHVILGENGLQGKYKQSARTTRVTQGSHKWLQTQTWESARKCLTAAKDSGYKIVVCVAPFYKFLHILKSNFDLYLPSFVTKPVSFFPLVRPGH